MDSTQQEECSDFEDKNRWIQAMLTQDFSGVKLLFCRLVALPATIYPIAYTHKERRNPYATF
jgi:hypothetical protein